MLIVRQPSRDQAGDRDSRSVRAHADGAISRRGWLLRDQRAANSTSDCGRYGDVDSDNKYRWPRPGADHHSGRPRSGGHRGCDECADQAGPGIYWRGQLCRASEQQRLYLQRRRERRRIRGGASQSAHPGVGRWPPDGQHRSQRGAVGGLEPDPRLHDRTRRGAPRRGLGNLRLRCDWRGNQHHHQEGLQRRRGERADWNADATDKQ
jgi:hypothetical protein